ncbi:MAG: hypothetical protein GWO24_09075, partial [Akkermansiaceae bacterium]|nr:hypothetical protein [Akkermansiaceae bacterium]
MRFIANAFVKWDLIGLGVLRLLTGSAGGADLFVSPDGDDASPGTIAAPFATVQRAAETAQPGDTLFLRGGTYRERVDFSSGEGNSGTPGNEIVVKPYAGEPVTLSAFEVVVPGQNGTGAWSQHAGAIWKIRLPDQWTRIAGDNLVRVNGIVKQEARWPNAMDAFNFDYRQMASSDSATFDEDSAGPQLPYSAGNDFYTATYTDNDFPVVPEGTWAGACIDLAPGGGGRALTGIVTNNHGAAIEFRYRVETNTDLGAGQPFYLWNNLAALDGPDEAFLDVEGVSGPVNTLYLW